MIGLSQAINDYKDHKNVRFSTFANLCIEREILTAITSLNRKNIKFLMSHYHLIVILQMVIILIWN